MAKIFTIRVWILIIALILSLIAINPNPFASGIAVKSVEPGSLAFQSGITSGEIILSINDKEINSIADYNDEVSKLISNPIEVIVETDKNITSYNITKEIGFEVNENLTILSSKIEGININDKLLKINSESFEDPEEFHSFINELIPRQRLVIKTNQGEYAYLTAGKPEITVENARKTNIVMGLDLQGGTRVLLTPISEKEITQTQMNDLVDVLENRLNVFGLKDVQVKQANDLEGNKFVLVEIAGASKEEVEDLIGEQGKFEAKIGDEVVFEGGERDVVFVCRDDGTCSGVRSCGQISEGRWQCAYEFQIALSRAAAKRHADVTRNIPINTSVPGSQGDGYLNEKLDLLLDGRLVRSLSIGVSLRGQETTQIIISGPGFGNTEDAAVENAGNEMKQLQTVLISGSLPFDIEIVKLDSISPVLGQNFIKNIFLVAFLAILTIAIIIFLRYRTLKILIPVMITSLSEILIILGIAALFKWNLDIVAIAGIIAAVGTGVDDQIVISDETLKNINRHLTWNQKTKRAFFIIFVAFFTTIAAMLPLLWAGAGLIRGFALTTIAGVVAGVFITRPAFASIAENLLRDKSEDRDG